MRTCQLVPYAGVYHLPNNKFICVYVSSDKSSMSDQAYKISEFLVGNNAIIAIVTFVTDGFVYICEK